MRTLRKKMPRIVRNVLSYRRLRSKYEDTRLSLLALTQLYNETHNDFYFKKFGRVSKLRRIIRRKLHIGLVRDPLFSL